MNESSRESDQRVFPNPDNDLLIAYIYHTHRIERIPMSKKTIEDTLAQRDPNPYVEGHLRAITLVLELAVKPDLIPETVTSIYDFDEKFGWLKRLHRNIMRPVAEHGQMLHDYSYIHPTQVAVFRDSEKSLTTERDGKIIEVEMPDPLKIRELLLAWSQDLCAFNQEHLRLINYGHYNNEEAEMLIQKAYEANLRISCIKPFSDGSNRLGRLVENLIRLNWGLPWRIISFERDKEQLLEDLRKMQREYSPDLDS